MRMNDASGAIFAIPTFVIGCSSLILSIFAIIVVCRKVNYKKHESVITDESDFDSIEKMIDSPTPESIRKATDEEGCYGVQIPETVEIHGQDCFLAVENEHPIPFGLRG